MVRQVESSELISAKIFIALKYVCAFMFKAFRLLTETVRLSEIQVEGETRYVNMQYFSDMCSVLLSYQNCFIIETTRAV